MADKNKEPMKIDDPEQLTASDFLEVDIYEEILGIKDLIERRFATLRVAEIAQKYKKKGEFYKTLNSLTRELAEENTEKAEAEVMGITAFSIPDDAEFGNLNCGTYVADDSGIAIQIDAFHPYKWIIRHPILPIERYKINETGEESVKIAFFRNHRWEYFTVPKEIIATSNKIVSLANRGIAVTSENAKDLVKCLSDLESFNEDRIPIVRSTIKLGWHGKEFAPYKTELAMDESNASLKPIQDAIRQPSGNYEKWLSHVKELRKSGNKELRIMMAASFASPLVEALGILPFFADLWGETEGGKTVALMAAASIWANPAESQYIKDYTSTPTALEVTADFLNNLPLILDDTSKRGANKEKSFEDLVYMLTNGQGKNRSNKDLGLRRTADWALCILTNGERPLSEYMQQGGAINRILEVRCPDKLFDDPHETADIFRKNYGHAGRKYIEKLLEIGLDEAKSLFEGFLADIHDDDKMQKQEMSVSAILTADKLSADYIFGDGIYLTKEDAKNILTDESEVSDNVRCYKYLMDMVDAHAGNFSDGDIPERWGNIKEIGGKNYIAFIQAIFERLCNDGKFSRKSFLAWASNSGILNAEPGRVTRVINANGKTQRRICIRVMSEEEQGEEFEFVDASDYENLPFK